MNEYAWLEPTDKWPVPPIDEWPVHDIRQTTRYAQQTEALVAELNELFQSYPAMRELHAVLDKDVDLGMQIRSSRKYTRFHFPNVRGLTEHMVKVLAKHGLACDPRRYLRDGYTYELATLRTGIDTNIKYKSEPCDAPKT